MHSYAHVCLQLLHFIFSVRVKISTTYWLRGCRRIRVKFFPSHVQDTESGSWGQERWVRRNVAHLHFTQNTQHLLEWVSSDTTEINKQPGVPQGSVLGHLMFSVYIHKTHNSHTVFISPCYIHILYVILFLFYFYSVRFYCKDTDSVNY